MSVVYDAGVLIAADRDERRGVGGHRARLEAGVVPVTTAPVVAQVSRSDRQVPLRRFLRGCEVVPFAPGQAHEVGALLGSAGTHDVVDAHLVVEAAARSAVVLTSDTADLRRLSDRGPTPVVVGPA